MLVPLAFAAQASAQPPAQPEPVRMVCFLSATPEGQVEIQIENPSDSDLDVALRVELLLLEGQEPRYDPLVPTISYRAPVDLGSDSVLWSGGDTRVQVSGGQSRTWTTQLQELRWHEKVGAARSADRAFRQSVPPGRYLLVLEARRGDSPWWRSNSLAAVVGDAGDVAYAEPDQRE